MRHLSFICLFSCVAIAGCNAQIDAKVAPTQASPKPSESLNVQIDAQVEESPKPGTNQIAEGRYWLGGTDQALEVQGSRFRYETEGGTQPWRSLSELKAVKTGVVSDGKLYWCLSTMQPESGATACSKEGWVTQQSRTELSSEPAQVKQVAPAEQNVDRTQEVMGTASTGEKVTLMLDSIEVTLRSVGFERPTYLFSYQIGAEKVDAVTSCNGEFQTTKDGTFYDNPVKPASAATQKMLDRVCTYRVKAFQVVNLPAPVKTEPQGQTLCTVQNEQSVTTFGQHQDYTDWLYTNVCGKIGLINRAQIQ